MSGKGPTLLLFTLEFPFGGRETFLESEIGFLAGEFPSVVALPSRMEGRARPVPENVEIEEGLARTLARRGRWSRLAHALGTGPFWRELARRPKVLVRPRRLSRLVGYSGHASLIRGWLEGYLPARRREDGEGGVDDPVLYAYWLHTAAAAMAMLPPGGRTGPAVARAHRFDLYEEHVDPPYIPLQRYTVEGLDRVFCVSGDGVRYLTEKYPDLADRLALRRLGVPDPGTSASPSSDGVFRIVSCSTLNPVKRVPLLVAALGELARRRPDEKIRWDHFGDGPERTRVEEAAAGLPGARVEWCLHGHLPNREVLAWYGSRPVDVFVNVSSSEGVPVSIMEAQSFGVPVVATAVGGTPEIVEKETGAPLPPDPAPGEVARALETFLPGSRGVSEAREGAKERWRRSYDASRNYARFARELRGLGPRVAAKASGGAREDVRGGRRQEEGSR